MNEETLRNAAWNALGIPYNPAWAFPKYAAAKGLGKPVTAEIDVGNIRVQGYDGGIVCAPVGQWDKVTHIPWLK